MPLTCEQVRSEILQQSIDRLLEMRSPATARIFDGEWQNERHLVGLIDLNLEELMNDSGEATTRIPMNNPVTDRLLNDVELGEDVHIVIDVAGWRWSGKATEIIDEGTEDGQEFVTVAWISEFEHMKHVVCYANPFFAAEFQWPKLWAYAGPSAFGVRTLLFLNLLRRFAPLWALPEDLFNPGNWLANLNPANWPIVVMPGNVLTDTSLWSVISTRFGMFYDVVKPTLEDAGLQITVRRWLPGDPQPAASHFTLTQATLVVDVVDKSGFVGLTGTAADGAIRFVTDVADDLINEVATAVDVPNPPEYGLSGYLGTEPQSPWVAWRNAHRTGQTGISSWRRVVRKITTGAIVTGGHSPDWVNTGLKLLINAALGYIGAIFGNPGLALGIFDSQVEDVVLAFHRVANPIRQATAGIRGPSFGESFESTGGTGFSLSALQAIRVGFWRSRAFTSYRFSVINGAPYWVGRHFGTGDRVMAEIGTINPHYHTDHVTAIRYGYSRTEDPKFTISIGNDNNDRMPGAMLARQIEQVRGVAQAIGVGS